MRYVEEDVMAEKEVRESERLDDNQYLHLSPFDKLLLKKLNRLERLIREIKC